MTTELIKGSISVVHNREIDETLKAISALLLEEDQGHVEHVRNLLTLDDLEAQMADAKSINRQAKAEIDRHLRILAWVFTDKALCEGLVELLKSADSSDGLEKVKIFTRKLRRSRRQGLFLQMVMPH